MKFSIPISYDSRSTNIKYLGLRHSKRYNFSIYIITVYFDKFVQSHNPFRHDASIDALKFWLEPTELLRNALKVPSITLRPIEVFFAKLSNLSDLPKNTIWIKFCRREVLPKRYNKSNKQ